MVTSATTLKYTNKIKSLFDEELKEPKDEFIRYFIREIYSGKATQNVVDKFKPIVKKALNQYISDLMNEKIKAALDASESESEAAPVIEEQEEEKKTIVTTALELEAFFLVKSICREVVESKRIIYKDTLSYFTVLLDNNTWKWICRLYLNGNKKYIGIPSGDKENKILINNIDDIYLYKTEIIEAVKAYLK